MIHPYAFVIGLTIAALMMTVGLLQARMQVAKPWDHPGDTWIAWFVMGIAGLWAIVLLVLCKSFEMLMQH